MRWGLIPFWAKDPLTFVPLINARAETAADKPAFRGAMRYRRCLVPADGYYEWRGRRGAKHAYFVRSKDRRLFAFGGLFETWLGADGSEIDTMSVLTVASNVDVTHIHDRMPLILEEREFDRWTDCSAGNAAGLLDILKPSPPGSLVVTAVGTKINDTGAEGPELQLPVAPTLL